MRQLLVIGLSVLALSACTVHRERNVSGLVDVINERNFGPKDYDFQRLFNGLKKRAVLYQETYLGNFTLLYSPIVTDSDHVLVPHVTCYDATIDTLPDHDEMVDSDSEVADSQFLRCRYYEILKYYASKPEFFFELEGRLDLSTAKLIARHWYAQSQNGRFIEAIYEDKSGYGIWVSGGACSEGVRAYIDMKTQSVTFKAGEAVQICS